MPHLNQCTFVGHLGRDPDVRNTQSGTKVANFSIAVKDREKVNGEWQDTTEWVKCVAFAQRAEYLEQYANKGDLVVVTGKMKTRSFEKDGITKYITEIIAFDAQPYPKADLRSKGNQSEPQQEIDLDDEIPF